MNQEDTIMISEHNINEWAERYLNKALTEAELIQMNKALDNDPELYRQWVQTLEILRTFESGAERKEIRNLIQSVAANEGEWNAEIEETAAPAVRTTIIPFRKYLRTTAAAAGLILFSSITTMFFMSKKDSKVDQRKFQELGREINRIKNSQSKIIDSLNKNKGGEPVTVDEDEIAIYGGTGFAISNDGYIATNYHVVKDANAIYVQTRKGDMEAYIVARDPSADIAIIKLVDKNYRFSKNTLPYNISKPVSGLGQRIFSIGYPKDEVVYNEGYISCENGYDGDAHSYQLEMTANPGQSGSPVFDKYGSVVGVVTGKQSNTTGTTFAVHSDALIELVQSLPKSAGIHLPESNKLNKLDRTEQVKKMRDFVFSVKVN